jgi:hypothetical protein
MTNVSVALYNGSGVLIDSHRDPELAGKMLEDHLAGSSKTEADRAFLADIWLGVNEAATQRCCRRTAGVRGGADNRPLI